MTTLGALVITLLIQIAAHLDATMDAGSIYVAAFRFVAIITGLLTLLLTIVTLRIRHRPPPAAITLGAVFLGVTPLLLAFIDSMWRTPR